MMTLFGSIRGFLLILCLSLCLQIAAAGAEDPPALRQEQPVDTMGGEEFRYDISFLWFDQLAEARLSFAPAEQPDTFRAVLEAKTLGVAAWLTDDRIQRYEALMKRDLSGQLRSLVYSSTIYKGRGKKRQGRVKTYTYDYAQRLVRVSIERDGKVREDEPLPMVEGEQPSDVLTAFFNFRAGIYGEPKPGLLLTIPTFSREGASVIGVEELVGQHRPEGFPDGGTLVRVSVDQEVFDTGGGYVYVWFDESGRPAQGMVENVMGMGNVRGVMR